jgi:hypothetical protein
LLLVFPVVEPPLEEREEGECFFRVAMVIFLS